MKEEIYLMGRFLGWILLLLPLQGSAQFMYLLYDSVPVRKEDGTTQFMPWAGGLNAAQYNTYDLNGDDLDDLVVFDRMANLLKTFTNEGDHYVYAPVFESNFPPLTNWLVMRDYDGDGRKDIFTGDALGIRVFRNTSVGDALSWQQYFFYVGPGLPKSNVLLTKGFVSKINLNIGYDELASFADVDNDGDLDILNFIYPSGSTVEFHRNFSMERYGHRDSLEFERITQKWGNFEECGCGEMAFSGEACPASGGGRIAHAGGKSVFAIDIDNDNDMDVLFSESGCRQLFLLVNEGDSTNPVFNSDQPFPTDDPVDMWIFPVPFYEDVTFDGKKDLIITPNVYNREFMQVDMQKSSWLFSNAGSTALPVLGFVRNDFLQAEMMDAGDNAAPAFFDVDGDGDLDMVVGRYVDASTGVTSLMLYRNEGNVAAPEFRLVDDDYLNLSAWSYINLKPQFADFNADGKIDLIFGATPISTLTTQAYVVYNKSATGLDVSGQTPVALSVPVLFNENIHAVDVNRDGKMDLLIGTSIGMIEYWKNMGTTAAPAFTLEEDDYLALGPSIERQNPALVTADLDADGSSDLLIGDQYGTVSIISNFREIENTAAIPVSNIIYDPVTDTYTDKRLGGRAIPTVANLFRTDRPSVVVGNLLGGLHLLRPENENQVSEVPSVRVFPVPVPKGDRFFVESDRMVTVQLISSLGQELGEPVVMQANAIYAFDTDRMSRGVYLVRILSNQQSFTRRIVVY
jgi:hypothetical protein